MTDAKQQGLRFLGVYRGTIYSYGRRTDADPRNLLKLTTPSGQLRQVELSRGDLLMMIRQCVEILERIEKENQA